MIIPFCPGKVEIAFDEKYVSPILQGYKTAPPEPKSKDTSETRSRSRP